MKKCKYLNNYQNAFYKKQKYVGTSKLFEFLYDRQFFLKAFLALIIFSLYKGKLQTKLIPKLL